MTIAANVARTALCNHCRQSVFRSFIATIGGSQAVATAASSRTPIRTRKLHTKTSSAFEDDHAINSINEQLPRGPQIQLSSVKHQESQNVFSGERQQDDVFEDMGRAAASTLPSGRSIVNALEELDVRDTWEEVVTLWQEDRMRDASQLMNMLSEEMAAAKGNKRTPEHDLLTRALKGRPKDTIPKLVDAIERAEEADLEHEDANGATMSRTTGQAEQEATELPSAASSRLPWYLQPSLHPQAQTTARQQPLPALPINPPTILTPLMNHLSVDLGMDDMSLIDLRTLDPPPALGSNLIMLLSTARSEKHLHTSADRLCRHLRSVYHLSPFADGLLGRNELKLKLRRRAKRSRLLSAVGAKSTGEGEIDDGIRTGWVCVNVGRVEGGELPEEVRKVQRREGFVGFGGQGEEGCGIVVQMLTADKRGEMDLEKLWLGILKRAGEDSKTGDSSEQKSRDGAAELEQMAGNTT